MSKLCVKTAAGTVKKLDLDQDSSSIIVSNAWQIFNTAHMTLRDSAESSSNKKTIPTFTYTCPNNGLLRIYFGAIYYWEIYCNNKLVQRQERHSSDACVSTWTYLFVKKNDVISFKCDDDYNYAIKVELYY